jgi:hypothetical protein
MNALYRLIGIRAALLLFIVTLMLGGYALILGSQPLRRFGMAKSRVHWLLYEVADFTGYSEEHPWAISATAIALGGLLIFVGGYIAWFDLVRPDS